MKFDLVKSGPCSDCPFRSDVAFYLRKEKRQAISDSLLNQNETFPCHKTIDYGDYLPSENEQHCGGALVTLMRSGHLFDNWRLRFAAILGMLDPGKIRLDAPVFDNMDQFVEGDLE